MQSKAKSVNEYLAELPAERRAALTKLRGLIRKIAPGAKESMQYGMPAFEQDGLACALASQKNYMSLYLGSVYCGCDEPSSDGPAKTAAKKLTRATPRGA